MIRTGWSNTVGKYSGTVFSLWLKADSPARWTTSRKHSVPSSAIASHLCLPIYTWTEVNYIPTSVSGVNIVSMIVSAYVFSLSSFLPAESLTLSFRSSWAIDLTGRRLTVIAVCLSIQIFGTILLLIWNVSSALAFELHAPARGRAERHR